MNDELVFLILGLATLALFYSIYFGKMLVQRRKGIRTDQMAKGNKRGRLFLTELLLKIATYVVGVMDCVSVIRGSSLLPVGFRWIGVMLAFAGVMFFGISVYIMRDSWRAGIPESDKTAFVTDGVYRISRNPAFLGFDLTYLGVLLMFFNPVLLVCSCFAMIMLHLQILQEETYLSKVFGKEYAAYKRKVRRYLGCKISFE